MNVAAFKCVECESVSNVDEVQYVCPSCGGDRNFTMWRYRPLLPIAESSPIPPLTVGWTPIYDCVDLAERYGIGHLLIKDDGRNPTGSFKDRPSALAVVKAKEAGATIITTA